MIRHSTHVCPWCHIPLPSQPLLARVSPALRFRPPRALGRAVARFRRFVRPPGVFAAVTRVVCAGCERRQHRGATMTTRPRLLPSTHCGGSIDCHCVSSWAEYNAPPVECEDYSPFSIESVKVSEPKAVPTGCCVVERRVRRAPGARTPPHRWESPEKGRGVAPQALRGRWPRTNRDGHRTTNPRRREPDHPPRAPRARCSPIPPTARGAARRPSHDAGLSIDLSRTDRRDAPPPPTPGTARRSSR